jgi:hypothetical protein
MKLFHMTSIQNAVAILREQEMHPGTHGLCGPGIYFGAEPDQLSKKAHSPGVILSADVDLGNVMVARKDQCYAGEDWAHILDHRGYDTVKCTGLVSGDEYVVYDSNRVRSIELFRGAPYLFTGRLQGSADGSAKPGRSFTKYPVRIVLINQRPSWRYPIRLGDNASDRLGWCEPASLTLA